MAKRALLIGINRYQMAGADLRGCVNDVKDLSAALVEFHGFKKGDITVLTDLRGDQEGDAGRHQGAGARFEEGRRGRCCTIPATDRTCPTTTRTRPTAATRSCVRPISTGTIRSRDDWLRTTLDGVRAGVNLTVIMDCCHSGTNTRAILPPDAPVKERYLPSPWALKAVESGRSVPKKVTSELRGSPRAARKARDIVKAELPEVLITGCRDTQTSADAFINGRYNGALTFALVEAIRKSQGPPHVQAAARPRGGRAQDEEVRAGAAARGPVANGSTSRCFPCSARWTAMKPSSEKRLQQLHPALASAVRAMIADLAAQARWSKSCRDCAPSPNRTTCMRRGGPSRARSSRRRAAANRITTSAWPSISVRSRTTSRIGTRRWRCGPRIGTRGGARPRVGRAVEEVPGQAARAAAGDDGQGMRALL